MDCILKTLASIFQSSPTHLQEQSQKCTMDHSSCKQLIDFLVLNFTVMFLARGKVQGKDFCIVLGGKQQKCF